jgi:hypothetical protein
MLATLSGVAQADSPCRARKAKPQKRTNTMLSPFTMLIHTVCRGVDLASGFAERACPCQAGEERLRKQTKSTLDYI